MNKFLHTTFALAFAGIAAMPSSALAQTTPIPYVADLSKTDDGWTNCNYNNDSETWMFFDGIGAGMSSNISDADDAYFSPAFSLEKGKNYKISVRVQLFNDPSESYHLAIAVGKSEDKSGLSQLKQISLSQQGYNVDFVEFSPTESGDYRFAFYNTTEANITNGAIIISGFGIEQADKTPGDDNNVFSDDFTADDRMGKWTTADSNADGVTWGVADGIDGITYNSDKAGAKSPADDWLFSPGISIEEGQDYLLSFSMKRQGAFDPDAVEVSLGGDASVGAMTKLLSKATIDGNAELVTNTVRFTGKQNGTAYLGFHVVTPSAENGQLSLTGVNVVKTGKTVPASVDNFNAVSSHKDRTVTLSWTNPSFDSKGVALTEPLQVKLLADDATITTVDGQKAGTRGSYTFSPSVFKGYATYKAVAMVGGNESEAVSMRINLDDVQGDTIVVKSFAVDSESSSEWAIQGDRSAWKYDYRNVFTFDYRKGGGECSEWLMSPLVKMYADRRYVLSYELKTSQDYGNNLEVTIGGSQDADSQTQVVAGYYNLKQNGFATYTTDQFTVPEDGTYSVGFHVNNSNYYVNMCNLSVSYIDDGTIVNSISSLPATSLHGNVTIYDSTGRMLGSASATTAGKALSQYGSGLYIVRTTDAAGNSSTVKIVK